MTDRELLEWALAALDGYARNCGGGTCDAAEALRIRLARAEEPDWSAAGFSKPSVRSEQWWKHEVSNAWAEGYEKGRASVKQPEQEPVAWIYSHKGQKSVSMNYVAGVRAIPLYTAPLQREWQGLTDEEYEAMAEKHVTNYFFDTLKYAHAIEAKLKEKNA